MGAEWVRTCAIITGEPNEVCAPIHNRMPVILDPADYGRWLGEETANQDDLLVLLKPYPAERMMAFPVDPRVGNVKHDDARLAEPVGTRNASTTL